MTSRINIGDFDLEFFGCGHRYRIYALPGAGVVEVSRIYPDPQRGRDIGSATGLDSDQPRFQLPSNWDQNQASAATVSIVAAYFGWRTEETVAARLNELRAWTGPTDVQ